MICMRVYHNFLCFPDPDQRLLKWIRIRPNDTNPDDSDPAEKLVNLPNQYKIFLKTFFVK